jgi:hypothetical protein
VRIRPATKAVIPAPSWCAAAIQPKNIGARTLPNVAAAIFTVGGTVAIQSSPYFSTYLLPTALDMPTEIVPIIMELADPNGPYGARGVAEMPLVPFAPAVAAAIHDATGAWLTDLPMTPERILAAIDASIQTEAAEAEAAMEATLAAP